VRDLELSPDAIGAGAGLAGVSTSGLGDGPTLQALPEQLARGWFAIVEEAALGFAVATIARSQLAGVGVGIALYFGEQFAGLFLPDIVKAQKDSEEDLSIYFSDIDHKVGKASATVDEMKEMVEIYKDTDFVINSERTNTVLSILTILFTLTIPATVISSIFGMNVPLPGGWNFGVTGPLDYFGPYTTLLFIFVAMLIPALIMAAYFRRVGWF